MKHSLVVLLSGFALVQAMGATPADDRTRIDSQLAKSATIIKELTSATTTLGIPQDVLVGSKCIAVVPGMRQSGFSGGDRGEGVATCKLEGGRWSAPGAFQITGGSFGAKAGTEVVDLVMMVMTDDGMKSLQSGHFKVGVEVDATTGLVGHKAETHEQPPTAILTYARAKGAYTAVTIQGAEVNQDNNATNALYGQDSEGKDANFADILNGDSASHDAAVRSFLTTIQIAEVKAKTE